MDDGLRQVDLEAEFPGWEFGYTISNHPRARRPNASPPVWLWGEDWADLRGQIIAKIAERPGLAGREQ